MLCRIMFIPLGIWAVLSSAVAARFDLLARPPFHSSRHFCKPIPSTSDWPKDDDWQALNASISGRLIAAVPPGAVCHTGWPTSDSSSCAVVSAQWSNTSFHAAHLLSVDYNDETCLPQADAPCSDAGYPEYVVEARSKEDVQAAVKFARRTGVRLVIKNTGHNFPGR